MNDLFFIPNASPQYVTRGNPFVVGGGDQAVQYPGNWLDSATEDDLAGMDAVPVVTEGDHGDPRLVVNSEEFVGPVRRLIQTPRPAEEVQAALVAYLADRRWKAEVQGTVWNGWMLATDRDSQSKYASELLAVQAGIRVDGSPWKFAHGFEALTNAQVLEMAAAARAHVLGCFALEGTLAGKIVAGEITGFEAIDAAFKDEFPPPVTE